MLKLIIEAAVDRASLATATFRDGRKILLSDYAAASAAPSISAKRSSLSWSHPPAGNYALIGHARNTGAPLAEYGEDQFLFYSTDSRKPPNAAQARADGLLRGCGLLVYSGALGADKALRCTQGGIRLSDKMAATIGKQLASQPGLTLTLRLRKTRTWWAFWRTPVSTPPLSATAPQALTAPHDERSLLAELLRRFIPEPTYATSRRSTRDLQSRRESRSSSSSSSESASSSGGSDSFRGQGGQSGGGGASGSWSGIGVAAGAAATVAAGAAMGSEATYTAFVSPFSASSSASDGGWSSSESNTFGSSDSSSSSDSGSSGGGDSGGGGGD